MILRAILLLMHVDGTRTATYGTSLSGVPDFCRHQTELYHKFNAVLNAQVKWLYDTQVNFVKYYAHLV